MTLHRNKHQARAIDYPGPTADIFDRLRFLAASKLQEFHVHLAGGGSKYIHLADLRIRFADHEETSSQYGEPDYNPVNRGLTEEELDEIASQLNYPRVVKKTAIAKHLGLTVPKLKKLLDDSCYTEICPNPAYPNTLYEVVIVWKALETAAEAGITERFPVEQMTVTQEDYSGSVQYG